MAQSDHGRRRKGGNKPSVESAAYPRIPLACYRLQFNKDLMFQKAPEVLEFLSRLGITDIYASPLLQSRSESQHGYDVTDPTRIKAELGKEEQFDRFRAALQEQGMGLLLDIVPNHMAANQENPWWMDVLENGPGSAYAAYFDIDWHMPSLAVENKLLLPVLGKSYGEVLDNCELRLVFERGSFFIRYYDMFFPLAPKTYRRILKHREHILEKRLGGNSPAFQEYLGIVAALAALPEPESLTIDAAGERRLHIAGIKERLRQLHGSSREVKRFVSENLRIFNGRRGQVGTLRNLDRLLWDQAYFLNYWQNVNEGINFRRFFTLADLVGVRVEDPIVFEATHQVIFRLVEARIVTGLRIDHIDGLRDPLAYLRSLQARVKGTQEKENERDFYVIVEKILSETERLPADWPIQGTTGYEFLNRLNWLFVHPKGARAVEEIYFRFLGRKARFDDVLHQKKKLVISTLFAAEMRYLSHQLAALAQGDRYARDLSRAELAQALNETTACLPVYRTYIRSMEVPQQAEHQIRHAVESARALNPHLDSTCFEFVRDVLLLKDAGYLFAEQREARLAFVMRWQQFTGAIFAKSLEDTVLYVYCPLLSLNEVGGNPSPAMVPALDLNQLMAERGRHRRHGLNSTSTHDTKRGEDVRARINVLSEIPASWQRHLSAWSRWNAARKARTAGCAVPDPNEEIFLYQTLIGAWPLSEGEIPQFRERLEAYIIKAIREAMVHTRWTVPNTAHEKAVIKFVQAILEPGRGNSFLDDFLKFQRNIATFGMINGLAQILVKMTWPGVPDFYQGCELWDLRFVDPDNRGPVDFKHRAALLAEIETRSRQDVLQFCRDATQNWHDGRIKLYLIWKILNLRRQHPGIFREGKLLHLNASGKREANVISYALRRGNSCMVTVAPRWLARAKAPSNSIRLREFWLGSHLILPRNAPESWLNSLTGETLKTTLSREGPLLHLADVFRNFPVAVLQSQLESRNPSIESAKANDRIDLSSLPGESRARPLAIHFDSGVASKTANRGIPRAPGKKGGRVNAGTVRGRSMPGRN
jgi:(1->4)-alpha-D-glucan 1-alpha-D-glucosylmutase